MHNSRDLCLLRSLAAFVLGGYASVLGMQANGRQPNYTRALAGTVLGGLLGGQIGAGTGRHVAIAAVAGIGALACSRLNCQ